MPDHKELHFFDNKHRFDKGLNWYKENYFKNYNNQKLIGEVTPDYLYVENVAERIYLYLGKDVKIIIILRNPGDRSYSHYLWNVRHERETMTFWDAIASESVRIAVSEK